jgi:hypothetical protein
LIASTSLLYPSNTDKRFALNSASILVVSLLPAFLASVSLACLAFSNISKSELSFSPLLNISLSLSSNPAK